MILADEARQPGRPLTLEDIDELVELIKPTRAGPADGREIDLVPVDVERVDRQAQEAGYDPIDWNLLGELFEVKR